MKRTYFTPSIEKIEFRYSEQVVASSPCHPTYDNIDMDGDQRCETGDPVHTGYTK